MFVQIVFLAFLAFFSHGVTAQTLPNSIYPSQLPTDAVYDENAAKPKVDGTGSPSDILMHDNDPAIRAVAIGELVNRQVMRCWTIAGDNGKSEKVHVTVLYGKDGTPTEISLNEKQRERYQKDAEFRFLADGAVKAIQKCSPLKEVPVADYAMWKKVEFSFVPIKASLPKK